MKTNKNIYLLLFLDFLLLCFLDFLRYFLDFFYDIFLIFFFETTCYGVSDFSGEADDGGDGRDICRSPRARNFVSKY